MPKYRIEPKSSEDTPETSVGPATIFFAGVLDDLLENTGARDIETGRIRRAKPTSLSKALKTQRTGKALRGTSQSSLYRLVDAKASPSIDVVYELAKAFKVSPHVFLPEDASD